MDRSGFTAEIQPWGSPICGCILRATVDRHNSVAWAAGLAKLWELPTVAGSGSLLQRWSEPLVERRMTWAPQLGGPYAAPNRRDAEPGMPWYAVCVFEEA